MRPFFWKRSKGFTAIETVVVVMLFSWVVLLISRMLLTSARATAHTQLADKATLLSDLILEQYQAYAQVNFANLQVYNVTQATPAQFFNAADNMGYDGILITSTATYSVNRSTCEVDVTLSWMEAGQAKSSFFKRTYMDNPVAGSQAAVQVFAMKQYRGSAPAPLPNATALALSIGGGFTSQGNTNSIGEALLLNVESSTATRIEVLAPAFSSFAMTNTTLGFATAYYVRDTAGDYVTSITTTVAISQNGLTLLYTTFQTAGEVQGTITNTDPSGPLDGLEAVLTQGYVAADSTSFRSCDIYSRCNVFTDANGRYVFSNVIPGETIHVQPRGKSGSAATVQPGPGFEWGYVSQATLSLGPNSWSANAPPVMTFNSTSVSKMGGFTVSVSSPDGTPAAGAIVSSWFPTTVFHNYFSTSAVTGSAGTIGFYNVIDHGNGPQSITFTATSADGQLAGQATWNCPGSCMAQNNISIQLQGAYQIVGMLLDPTAGPTTLTNVQVSVPIFPSNTGATTQGTTDATHFFTLNGFYPANYTSNPQAPNGFPVTFTFQKSSLTMSTNISGTVTDAVRGEAAPSAGIYMSGAAGNVNLYADASGNFSTGNISPGWQQTKTININCSASMHVCTPVTNPIQVQTGQGAIYFSGIFHCNGWHVNAQSVSFTSGVPVTGVNLTAILSEFAVRATVTDQQLSVPVSGIFIQDDSDSSNQVLTSTGAPAGVATIWCSVQGRSAASPGSVEVYIPSGQSSGGEQYQAAYGGLLNLPAPSDISQPILETIALPEAPGNHG